MRTRNRFFCLKIIFQRHGYSRNTFGDTFIHIMVKILIFNPKELQRRTIQFYFDWLNILKRNLDTKNKKCRNEENNQNRDDNNCFLFFVFAFSIFIPLYKVY